MATTSWGLRYPVSGDSPTVYQHIQNLANDVQTYTLPRFASIAARNAAFPSPLTNQAAIVSGRLHVYDGTAWRFELSGSLTSVTSGGTDGLYSFPHGGGQTPRDWSVSLPQQPSDAISLVLQLVEWGSDSTNLTVRTRREDSNAWFPGTVFNLKWRASF